MQIRLAWQWNSLWIGAHWQAEEYGGYHRYLGLTERRFDLRIGLIPCLQLHLSWFLSGREPVARERKLNEQRKRYESTGRTSDRGANEKTGSV